MPNRHCQWQGCSYRDSPDLPSMTIFWISEIHSTRDGGDLRCWCSGWWNYFVWSNTSQIDPGMKLVDTFLLLLPWCLTVSGAPTKTTEEQLFKRGTLTSLGREERSQTNLDIIPTTLSEAECENCRIFQMLPQRSGDCVREDHICLRGCSYMLGCW